MAGSYVHAFLDGDAHRLIEIDLVEASQDDPLARRLAAMVDAYGRALGPVERDALARLALFARGASAETLAALAAAGGEVAGSLAGADTAAIERALARLESLGLARRHGRAYRLHPFVAQMAKRGLGAVETAVHRLEVSRLDDLLADRPGELPSDARGLDRFEDLLHHLLGAGRSIDALHLYHRRLGGFAHLGLTLGDMIRGARIASALDTADGLPPPLAQLVRYDRGLYAGALGDLAVALSSYASYCAVARRLGDARGLTTGLRTSAYTLRLAGDLTAAFGAVQEACEVAASLGDSGHLVRGVALRAAIRHDRGHVDEAERDFALVRARGDDPVARRGLWEAEHLVDLGKLDEARSRTERNLGFCEARGWTGHAAHCHAVLGLIAARQGEEDAARRHLGPIDAWTDRTGEVEMILRARQMRGSLSGGRKAAEEAAARAGRLGFALFQVRLLRLARLEQEADRRAAELGYAW